MTGLTLLGITNSMAFYIWFLWYWKKTRNRPYNLHDVPSDASVFLPFLALLITQSYRFFQSHIDFGSFSYYPWRNIFFELVQCVVVLSFCYFGKNKFKTLGFTKEDFTSYVDVLVLAIPILTLGIFNSRDSHHVPAILIFLRWFLVAVGESLLFQAFMQTRLQLKFGFVKGLWITALIFGFYHIILKDGTTLFSTDQDSIVQMIQAGLIRGPMLGYLYSKQKSIFPLIILHAAWDLSV